MRYPWTVSASPTDLELFVHCRLLLVRNPGHELDVLDVHETENGEVLLRDIGMRSVGIADHDHIATRHDAGEARGCDAVGRMVGAPVRTLKDGFAVDDQGSGLVERDNVTGKGRDLL